MSDSIRDRLPGEIANTRAHRSGADEPAATIVRVLLPPEKAVLGPVVKTQQRPRARAAGAALHAAASETILRSC